MIAVDSQVFIWGIKKTATENREHMIARAEQMISDAAKAHEIIMVPSLVLSECLVQYAPDARIAAAIEIEAAFFVPAFDVRAAILAAEFFAQKEAWNKARSESGSTKARIKVDISILATVEAQRPERFYVEDNELYILAERLKEVGLVKTPVHRLPDPSPRQTKISF